VDFVGWMEALSCCVSTPNSARDRRPFRFFRKCILRVTFARLLTVPGTAVAPGGRATGMVKMKWRWCTGARVTSRSFSAKRTARFCWQEEQKFRT